MNRRSIDPDIPERRDLISKAISIAHEEIISGRKVQIRDQKDEMEEYSIATASPLPSSMLNRKQSWARRDCLDDDDDWGMYGANYMTERYKVVTKELFENGVAHSSDKMSPAQMREEIENRYPGFYTYPPESEITKYVSALFDAEKKAKLKNTKEKQPRKISEKVDKKIKELMDKHPDEKGAAIADRTFKHYQKKIPGCTGKDVLDRVNSLRQQERNKIKKLQKRKLIG